MRNYESLYIVHPEVTGDELTALTDKFQKVLTDLKAEIHLLDNWGTRKLAYPIKKLEQGCYVQTLFQADPQIISEFERRLRLDEKILRFLTVRFEGDFPPVQEPAEEVTEQAEEAVAEAKEEE